LKKNRISKNWLIKRHKDQYFKQSKNHGYRSRSAFKLIEMDQKFKFLNQNTCLLDLGTSPGGWAQVAAKKIIKGKILAVDIKTMESVNKVNFLKRDLLDHEIYKEIYPYFNKKIDVVISDMATNTSGNKNLDSYKTGELCLRGMDLAQKILRQDGVFLSKLFMGSIFMEIHKRANKYFKKVVKYKPLSSRKESKEIYIYCKGIAKSFNFSKV
jgi:23S rRNA (uridine2552-2'-O)-methyltransferase